MQKPILILGACGQIGTELTAELRKRYGANTVIASDIREGSEAMMASGPFELLDATDYSAVEAVVTRHKIDEVYALAAMLSATAEQFPMRAWNLNMSVLFTVLNLAKERKITKVFWPSSIAAFGPSTPREHTPQHTIMEPSTVYGISKQAGERWCDYYYHSFGVDVRSVRYPGLISWKTMPGGGTTDYAVEIYHEALEKGTYTCFLEKNTELPMMYMDDAVRATIRLMESPAENIKIRSSYNLAGMSFTPQDMKDSIRKHLPNFTLQYAPDFRQRIADSWPKTIDDTAAKQDWGWQATFDLDSTTAEMLHQLQKLQE